MWPEPGEVGIPSGRNEDGLRTELDVEGVSRSTSPEVDDEDEVAFLLAIGAAGTVKAECAKPRANARQKLLHEVARFGSALAMEARRSVA